MTLTVSIENFQEGSTIWLSIGSMQLKWQLPLTESTSFVHWLLDKETWPAIGIPLPGSQQIDYFRPENKELAELAFGFHGQNLQAFKFWDLEYNAKALELKLGLVRFVFLEPDLAEWLRAAKGKVQY